MEARGQIYYYINIITGIIPSSILILIQIQYYYIVFIRKVKIPGAPAQYTALTELNEQLKVSIAVRNENQWVTFTFNLHHRQVRYAPFGPKD